MSHLGSPERPLRVAIIGSGPSGFYSAEELLAKKINVKVDMFEKLPAPYGLVRYGVAPDHPKIKNVIKVYEKTATHPQFSFLGNVQIGKDISIEELKKYYDAIILTCGAQSDRRLGIKGEDLTGNYTATEFVAWYNGHPEYKHCPFDLSTKVAVIIGQGNVAMDVGRILCKTVDELKNTDIATHALDVLASSQIQTVYLVGRRGPAQAAFTPIEIKEFGEFHDCDPIVDQKDLELNAASQKEIEDPHQAHRKKNLEILKELANKPVQNKKRKLILTFYKGPKEILGTNRVEKIVLEKNVLQGEPGNQQAVGTGQLETVDCGVVFRSVGYRGVAMPGVPFDERKGIIPNDKGRVIDQGRPFQGFYVSGWIKRGPSGVIGTNKPDSVQTVESLMADLNQLTPCVTPDSQQLLSLLKSKNIKVISFADWKKIDAAEIERGKSLGKPREKFVDINEMLVSI